MACRGARLLVIVGVGGLACARPSPPASPPSAAPSPPSELARPAAPLNATAPQTIAYAIGLLEGRQYARLIEELSEPERLSEMKAAGKFESTVARFEAGWGEVLLGKLRRAQGRMPHKREDGALMFSTMENGVPMRMIDHPIVLVERNGHWYFSD